jgi:CBS domain containing-hemolysin-like protein
MQYDPWLLGAAGALALLLIGMGLLSSLETAVLNARRARLSQLPEDARRAAAEAVLDAPEHFQTSAHLAKSLAESVVYALAALMGLDLRLAAQPGGVPNTVHGLLEHAWSGILAGAVLAFLVVTIFAETLPKVVAARAPEQRLLRWAGFIRIFTLVFMPVRVTTAHLARGLALGTGVVPHLTPRGAHSEEEIKLLVEDSVEEGVFEQEEKEMIHSVLELGDTVARQIMVPRIDVSSVDVEASVQDVVRTAMESGHSRFPVYEGTLDTVVGVVHVKDLLPRLLGGEGHANVRGLMRAPYYIPEGKKLDELLREFRKHNSQLAIVVDEFGGTSGVVTVEDVLEEIVGEIQDEYDAQEHVPDAHTEEPGRAPLVDARMTIADVNDLLKLELPEDEYDTLGGLVFGLLGRPAELGERLPFGNVEFVVEDMDGLRLLKIRVEKRAEEDAATVADEGGEH